MKIEHKDIGKNTVRYTTCNERWYLTYDDDGKITRKVPSVTWILNYMPTSPYLIKWIAEQGLDEAENVKKKAGVKGSKVHNAIEDLLLGNEVKHDSLYFNELSKLDEELSAEEYKAIYSFSQWFAEFNPKTVKTEFNIIGKEYAGTIDYVCTIEKQNYLIDFKTSAQIYDVHRAQVSAYKHLLEEETKKKFKMAILQVGYNRNKKGYKFTEIEDLFPLFESAKAQWAHAEKNTHPKEIELPLKINL